MNSKSEIILNKDGSIYHLHLLPEQISDTIILVGDPDRVALVSKHFDKILHRVQNREFLTHTGELKGKKITVISTGIGTDNIDIVLNELDILANYDLKSLEVKKEFTSLNFIRIGTSGSLQADVKIDSFIFSDFGIGLDGLLNFYEHENQIMERLILDNFLIQNPELALQIKAYIAQASPVLKTKLAQNMPLGITATCAGFYAPQGRKLRFQAKFNNLIENLNRFDFQGKKITNFEMETAGILGLAKVLGHEACSLNAILANRITGEFSEKPQATIEKLIAETLEKLVN